MSVIEKLPLQTYGAALAFSPTKREIHTQYWKDRLSFVQNITGMRETWDPCLQSQAAITGLEGAHFLPDGKFYASFSSLRMGAVQLFETDTGSCMQTISTKMDEFDPTEVNVVAIS